jgi:lipopolysaccharide export system permease protein
VKVVDRHLAGEFSRLFLITASSFLGLFLVVTFFEKLRLFLKYDASVGDAILFLGASIPWMISQILPMATLLGTLLSLLLLARHGEITALRCGGVPLRRLAAPYLACGAAVALCNVFVQEIAAPRGFTYAREVQEVRIKKRPPSSLLRSENLWLHSGSRILHVNLVAPEGGRLIGVTVVELAHNRVVRRVDAAEARWSHDRWELAKATVRTFDDSGIGVEEFERLPFSLGFTPEEFRISDAGPDEDSWLQLRRRARRLREQGIETRALDVALWGKTSLPFANLVMPLLAFPFAVGAGRRGSASLGIVAAVCLGFGYWFVLALAMGLGNAGVLPPALAAWAGNLLFGAAGVWLLIRAERVA